MAAIFAVLAVAAGMLVMIREPESPEAVAMVEEKSAKALWAVPWGEVAEFYDFDHANKALRGVVDATTGPQINPAQAAGIVVGAESSDPDLWAAEFGIDPEDFSAVARWGTPPHTSVAISGEFVASRIERAVKSDTNWRDLLSESEYRGIRVFTWGSDLEQDAERASVLGGVGRRMALVEGIVLITKTTDDLARAIDRVLDRTSNLDRQTDLIQAIDYLWERAHWSALVGMAGPDDDLRFSAWALAPAAIGRPGLSNVSGSVVAQSDANASLLAEEFRQAARKLSAMAEYDESGAVRVDRRGHAVFVSLNFDLLPAGRERPQAINELFAPLEGRVPGNGNGEHSTSRP